MVRSLHRDLTEPWEVPGHTRSHSGCVNTTREIEGEFVRLRYDVPEFNLKREALLTPLEAAALNWALEQSGRGSATPEEKRLVESVLGRMDPRALLSK